MTAHAQPPEDRTDIGRDDPAATAHRIRELASAVGYALELIRLTGSGAALPEVPRLAARQVGALARLADEVHDPVRAVVLEAGQSGHPGPLDCGTAPGHLCPARSPRPDVVPIPE